MKRRPLWQNLQIVGYVVGGLAALGTVIVVSAKYINLPRDVEAAEQKNVLQDEAIIELKKSNEIWQQMYQQQTANQSAMRNLPIIQRKWDDEKQRYYCDDGREQWWENSKGDCE